MDIVRSKNGVSIRLPEERWFHITEEHSEMAGYYFEVLETVEQPEAIYEGKADERLAIGEVEKDNSKGGESYGRDRDRKNVNTCAPVIGDPSQQDLDDIR